MIDASCTEACEAMPDCAVCGKRKGPRGRSAPLEMANSLCDWDCRGYSEAPSSGHLWPGELAREREDAAERDRERGEGKDSNKQEGDK